MSFGLAFKCFFLTFIYHFEFQKQTKNTVHQRLETDILPVQTKGIKVNKCKGPCQATQYIGYRSHGMYSSIE